LYAQPTKQNQERSMSEEIRNRAQRARNVALTRLSKMYIEDYRRLYKEEATALGIKVHPDKSERIARLQAEVERLSSE
jgi:hypothetical protein